MLNRFLIRERVNLLVALPLMVILFMTVPFIADRLQSIRTAHQNAESTSSAREVGRLVEALGRERALSVGYLLTPNSQATSLVEQAQTVDDDTNDVKRFFGGNPPAKVGQALGALHVLEKIRTSVQSKRADFEQVETVYNTAIDGLINSLAAAQQQSGDTGSRDFLGLTALLTGNEQSERAATDAMGMLLDPRPSPAARERQLTAQAVARQVSDQQIALFRSLAGPGQVELYDQVASGGAATDVARLESQSQRPSKVPALETDRARLASQLYSAVETDAQLRELVAEKIARDAAVQATAAASHAREAGVAFAGLALALLALTLLLSIAIGRSITRPLRRLTVAAGLVADVAGAELARVADDDSGAAEPPRLAAIDLDRQDEIGELAGVVNRVQAAAILLLERQLTSHANMNAMFRSVGRRTQNLVNRQTAVIEKLERDEQDAEVLERLYGLDHLTARLRRHADSLLVLSGWTDPVLETAPASLAVLIRAAFGGVEDFQRIRLLGVPDLAVSADLANDLILLLAELLDNATRFSPPHTEVRVDVRVTEDGLRIAVIDQGIGMPPDRLARENQRMVRRERLDLVPTDVLGLFVVGRLCRKHGLRAWLRPADGGGVQAVVEIPTSRLAAPDQASQVSVARLQPRPSDPMPGGPLRPSPAPVTVQQPVAYALEGSDVTPPGAAARHGSARDAPGGCSAGTPPAEQPGSWGDVFQPVRTRPGDRTEPAGAAGTEDIGETMARMRAGLEHLAAAQEGSVQGGFAWFEVDDRVRPLPVPAHDAVASASSPGQAAPSVAGLVRRVPGAHLFREAIPTHPAPAEGRTIDAAALRASLDEFEAAVDRGRARPGSWPDR